MPAPERPSASTPRTSLRLRPARTPRYHERHGRTVRPRGFPALSSPPAVPGHTTPLPDLRGLARKECSFNLSSTFDALGVSAPVSGALKQLGIERPFAIQNLV